MIYCGITCANGKANGGKPYKPQQPFHKLYGSMGMSALWSQQLALDQNERFYLSRVDALDDMPYFSISKNHGKTWSEPIMIAAPGVDMDSISAAFTSDGTAWASFTRDTCVIDESSDAVQCDGNFDYNGLRFYAVIARMEE